MTSPVLIGAAAGAGLGSVVPVVGTALGAGLGAASAGCMDTTCWRSAAWVTPEMARKIKETIIEEVPMAQSRSRALIDPAVELEAVKRQQALFTETAKLSQLRRQDSMAKRWDIVGRFAVPTAATILLVAGLAVALFILNWVASCFWNYTHWL